jgi:hypothetical protein
MPVKPASGETIVEEKRTRIEGAGDPKSKEERGELWDFVEALNEADWASGHYRMRIERGQPTWKSEDRVFVADLSVKILPPEIQQRWGGGDYTIWFKGPPKGQQILYKKLLRIDGAPIATNSHSNGNGSSIPGGVSNDPLVRLIEMMDRRMQLMEETIKSATGSGVVNQAVQQAVSLSAEVFKSATTSATNTLQSLNGNQPGRPDPMAELNIKFMTLMMERMMNPPTPTDPIKTFGEMVAAIKGLGILGGGGPAANPWAQIGAQVIQSLPQAIHEGVKGLEFWSKAEENRFRTAAIMRGGNPEPINVSSHPAAPAPVAPGAPPAPPPVAVAPSPEVAMSSFDPVERGLANILNNPALTIEDAANQAAALMENLMPGLADRVASSGEDQILQLFEIRPILQQVPKNPRLTEFIKKFMEVVRGAPIQTQMAPSNIPPA